MATDLETASSLQALADSTALIYDRAISPEKVVGQAWLISKGRVVTTASAVTNYSEAPWALVVKFPHPDVTYGVRTVQLHPDFSRRDARDHYLSQAHGTPSPFAFDNDIATLALDSDLSPPAPERVAELNRALSVPFQISPRDMSGSMRPGDLPNILQSVITTGRSGLLTMVDVRNIPFARIGVRQARITKVTYESLYNELALCELLFKKPLGNFAFQPIEDYRWPADLHELSTTAEQIVSEGLRRADELSKVIEMLGGMDVRFGKATKFADFSTVPSQERWVAERLWEVLDGMLPLSKVSGRIGADTYSTVKMVWEFANMGLIQANQKRAFHSNGQLGSMLVPAQDMELSVWDNVTAFYLDSISAAPAVAQGNLFGPAKLLNNKTLLHTVSLPPGVSTAAMLKDGKLIGIYTGSYVAHGNMNMPPMGLNRMTWVGALNELGAKRLRTSELATGEAPDGAPVEPDKDQAVSQRISIRNRAMSSPELPSIPLEDNQEELGALSKFTKKQLATAAGGSMALAFILLLSMMFSPHGGGGTTTASSPSPAVSQGKPGDSASGKKDAKSDKAPPPVAGIGDAAAAKLAQQAAGFGTPPDTFVYKDCSKLTDPKPSWELVSELKNLDIMFVVWPNPAPYNNGAKDISARPPFADISRWEYGDEFKGETEHTRYVAGHYSMNKKNEKGTALVGALPYKDDPNKCIIFVAKPASGLTLQEMSAPPNLIEQLIQRGKSTTTAMNFGDAKPGDDSQAAGAGDSAVATPEQLADYRKKLVGLIQGNYKEPQADKDADTKVGMLFTIDADGQISDLQMKPNTNDDFNKAIKKAFNNSQPLPKPPHTKNSKYALAITANGSNISVDEQ